MFICPILPRSEWMAWPINEAGLPIRAVHCAERLGIRTLGAWFERSMNDDAMIRGLGSVTRADLRDFFQLIEQLEQGRQYFLTLDAVLDRFIEKAEKRVLLRRYGWLRTDDDLSRKFMSLQEIGNETLVTRERTRQVLEQALHRLRQRMALHCLTPFYRYVARFIDSRDRLADMDQLRDLDGQAWLSGYHAASVCLLLSDLTGAHWVEHRQTFSTWPKTELEAVEALALARLRALDEPIANEKLFADLALVDTGWTRAAFARLLARHPRILTTTDQRHYCPERSLPHVMAAQIRSHGDAMHYRDLTRTINESLTPASRQGPGTILAQLNADTRFVRVAPGRYHLRG